MTEITENPDCGMYRVNLVAFIVALIGAPLLFTAATFWLFYIPLFALAIGGIPYLVIGTPVLWHHLRRKRPVIADIAWLACVWNIIAMAVATAIFACLNPFQAAEIVLGGLIAGVFGSVFSTGWGATFGWLYIRNTRVPLAQDAPL